MLQDNWLTVEETAALLHLSPRTVNKLIQAGELRSVKIGSSRRIPRAAIVELEQRLNSDGDQ